MLNHAIFYYLIFSLSFNYLLNRFSRKTNKITLSTFGFIATIVPTWYGGILAVSEFYYNKGIIGWLSFSAPYHCYLILLLIFINKIRNSSYLTIPELFANHYSSLTGKIASVLIMLHTSPATYILMSSFLLSYVTGVSKLVASIAICTYIFITISIKSFNSVKISNFIDFCMMYLGLVSLFIFCQFNTTSFTTPISYFPATFEAKDLHKLISCYVIASSTIIDPNFFFRVKMCKDNQTAVKGIIGSLIFFIIFDFCAIYCTGLAKIFSPNLSQPALSLLAISKSLMPHWINTFFNIAILSISLSSAVSYTYSNIHTLSFDILKQKHSSLTINLLVIVFNFLIAQMFTSIIDVWYYLGSISIPGLIILMLCYYCKISLSSKAAIIIMLTSTTSASIWSFSNTSYSPVEIGICSALSLLMLLKSREIIMHKLWHNYKN
ncbi:SLC5/6 family protein [Rickettsiales endosymbiont of Stachyamoeba lipophora]|uniref:hypothetical protein n=1 Tax=Rickettsiales endosymbiont of Stachyamoeba lipophora TaxID=2486578 RepID=UPI000F652447|nr:hypothetical protein [Rickettsiales endosymbiont of Stachyamoeba lipophora]AZL15584.1 hypothetical protein EF513_03340 [Rickettsiales endosymbiont of Stachyamoeba lipophora]